MIGSAGAEMEAGTAFTAVSAVEIDARRSSSTKQLFRSSTTDFRLPYLRYRGPRMRSVRARQAPDRQSRTTLFGSLHPPLPNT